MGVHQRLKGLGTAAAVVLVTASWVGAGHAAPTIDAAPAGRVLAAEKGIQGMVRVEEREGRRVLTIDGIVQGAARAPAVEGTDGAIRDPIVQLIAGLSARPRSALLVGLGTGATASDLQLLPGLVDLEVVELEPAVVSFARKYFGYRGPASVGDGLARLLGSNKIYDLVILDLAIAAGVPAALADLQKWRKTVKLSEDGVLAVRLVGRPNDEPMRELVGGIMKDHGALFGSGVGLEEQNLYVFTSAKLLRFSNIGDVAAWPLVHPDYSGGRPVFLLPQFDSVQVSPAGRQVRLSGYLVRLRENAALAIDMVHPEMGAMRFLVKGPLLAELEAHLRPGDAFPTNGELLTDGDLSGTMADFVGEGDGKGSEIRFSRVFVSVEGIARLDQLIDPAIHGEWRFNSQKYPKPELLPWGGGLYQLEVTKVIGTVDKPTAAREMRLLRPLFRRAERRLEQRDPLGASRALASAAEQFSRAFGPLSESVSVPRITRAVAVALERESAGAKTAAERKAACRRVQSNPWGDDEPYGSFYLAGLAIIPRALAICAGDPEWRRMERKKP